MNLRTGQVIWNLIGRAAAATSLVASFTLAPTLAAEAKPDLYIMSMSHQPEFCFKHRSEAYAGCQQPIDYWKTHLTIHGLWPEYKDGSWPSTCTREKLNPETIDRLKDGLDVYWPNVKEPDETSPLHKEFWNHEWTKHGTCSGLSQDDYFESALHRALPTPEIVKYGKKVDKASLLQAYGGADKVVAVCSGKGKFLSEVRSCLAVEEDGMPGAQVTCPTKTLQEDSCGETIIISKFPSTQPPAAEGSIRGVAADSSTRKVKPAVVAY